MAPILKHGPEWRQGPCLWILAGTGEGPALAGGLLQQGWRLRVSVVSEAAALPYRPLAQAWPAGALQLLVGALAGQVGIRAQLQQWAQAGDRLAAVVDATHPFAIRISRDLVQVCCQQQLPLLRLGREALPQDGATVLADLAALTAVDLGGQRLLLALGSRQLARARAASPGAFHHARVLPNPAALQLALAAGLAPERLACLRPSPSFAVEEALLRHWGIEVILCRQSGGVTEAGWRRLAITRGCRLLLLARPAEPGAGMVLSLPELLAKLESLATAH